MPLLLLMFLTAKRIAATMLQCPANKVIKIIGAVPVDKKGKRIKSAVNCPYVKILLKRVQPKCNDQQQCKLKRRDIKVRQKHCPGAKGIYAVNYRVKCIRKGTLHGYSAGSTPELFATKTSTIFQYVASISVSYN